MQLEQPPTEYLGTPQTEDGYTRIANELLDAILVFPFSKRELLIVMAVIRKTYGYNKKHDALSIWQLAGITGIDKSHVSRSVSSLLDRGILTIGDGSRYSHGFEIKNIGLNKLYKLWRTGAETTPVLKQHRCQISHTTGAETATQPVLKQPQQKTTTKDNTKRQASFVLPDWVNSDDWALWLKTRKGKKMIPEQMQKQVNKLSKWREIGLDYGKALSDAAENGWQGLFEPKGKTPSANPFGNAI